MSPVTWQHWPDLANLQHEYTISAIQPVDMFPQTYHVESIVLMSRVEK